MASSSASTRARSKAPSLEAEPGFELAVEIFDSALAQWFRTRTENARGTRKTMIVALARKVLIALWRLVREGVVPDGIVLRPAQ